MTSRLFSLLLALALTAGLTACRDNDGPEAVEPAVANIVTFVENNADGALFAFRRIDDSPNVTLQAAQAVDTADYHPGSRVLISYIPATGDGYTSTDITLRGISAINNGKVTVAPIADFPLWDRDGVYVYSLWRSGRYINLHCRLTYDKEPRRFTLVADKATVKSPNPTLYLVHEMKDEGVNSFSRAYYASWDISDIWDTRTCRGVEIRVANTNLPSASTFRFDKP